MLFIGDKFAERMNLLEMNVETVSDLSFVEVEDINNIINNNISLNEINKFDLDLLCSVLHCKVDYFTDENVRKNDILNNSLNRGEDDLSSKRAKAKIQDFINDFEFLSDLMENC